MVVEDAAPLPATAAGAERGDPCDLSFGHEHAPDQGRAQAAVEGRAALEELRLARRLDAAGRVGGLAQEAAVGPPAGLPLPRRLRPARAQRGQGGERAGAGRGGGAGRRQQAAPLAGDVRGRVARGVEGLSRRLGRPRPRVPGALHHRRQRRLAPSGGADLADGSGAALRGAQAAQPRAQGARARPRRDRRQLPRHRLRRERIRGPHSLERFREEVEAALPRRRAQPGRGRRRAAHFLSLSEGAVEDDPHHQRHRAAQRGVSPAGEDAGIAARRGGRARAALQLGGGASNCSGCCVGNTCNAGTSTSACGAGGAACHTCSVSGNATNACVSQACVCQPRTCGSGSMWDSSVCQCMCSKC